MRNLSHFLRFKFKREKDSSFGIFTKWGMMAASKVEEECLLHISEYQ